MAIAFGVDVLGLAVVGLMDVGADVVGVVFGLAVAGLMDDGAKVVGVVLGLAVVGLIDVGDDGPVGLAVGIAKEATLMSNTGTFVASPILYVLRVLP